MKFESGYSREKDIRSVTLLGAILNVVLMVLKISVGFFIKSTALIADGVHSLSDLATDFIVLVGTRFSSRPPDETHPYGHGKIETLASLFIAVILFGVGVGFVWSAGSAIYRKEVNYPGFLVLVIAAVSVVTKERIFFLTRKVARKTHSPALYANAWHHRSDSFSSVAVLLGGAASLFGWGYADHVAAVVVGFMIIAVGGKIFHDNLIELTEHAADSKSVQVIKNILSDESEISGWHALRTRSSGGELYIDVHVIVDPKLTVLESHKISDKIETNIQMEIAKPINILIHIDPNND